MLQKPKDLAEKILMDLRYHCAEDPITGASLMRSNGHRKSGRPRKYWYRAPGMINAMVIYAETDDDAIRQIEGENEISLPQYECVNCGRIDNDRVIEDADHPGMGMCKQCTCTVFVCGDQLEILDDATA